MKLLSSFVSAHWSYHVFLFSFFSSSSAGCSHYRSDDFDYSGMETVELSEKVKLEESCVMVDSSALYAVAQRTQKLGSFKVLSLYLSLF